MAWLKDKYMAWCYNLIRYKRFMAWKWFSKKDFECVPFSYPVDKKTCTSQERYRLWRTRRRTGKKQLGSLPPLALHMSLVSCAGKASPAKLRSPSRYFCKKRLLWIVPKKLFLVYEKAQRKLLYKYCHFRVRAGSNKGMKFSVGFAGQRRGDHSRGRSHPSLRR